MNSYEYIISELNKFILEFPKTRVRYEHDNSSETHFIEVVPNEIYHLDAQYIQWESEMFDRFVDLFPEENICFISDDALVGLDKINFELKGHEFISLYSTCNKEQTIENTVIKTKTVITATLASMFTTKNNANHANNACTLNLSISGDLIPEDNQNPYLLAA